ncbi:MAG: Rab family GTPase [Thermoplasmata archaeon]
MEAGERLKAKICLLGEAAVGKTSLVRRYVLDEFDDGYITTLGAKISKKELQMQPPDGEGVVHMDMLIWDIMGEKQIRDLLREAFFLGTQGIIAVCDLLRQSSLRALDEWVESVFQITGPVPVIYAINKSDLRDEAVMLVGEREVDEYASAFDSPFYLTSAKTGENVEPVFYSLGERILENILTQKAVAPDAG